jgi:hypothetical protein
MVAVFVFWHVGFGRIEKDNHKHRENLMNYFCFLDG